MEVARTAAGGVKIGSTWQPMLAGRGLDDLLTWPPDVFALVDRALEASEAYRFVVSPPPGREFTGLGGCAATAASEWWEWLDATRSQPPESVTRWWKVVRDAAEIGIDALARGDEWPVIEALLTLHAIADEACAGLGTASAVRPGAGCAFRGEARELFAESGSLSRLLPGVLRVLPRCRAGIGGISIHSLSRHVCVRGPQVDVDWHRMPSQPAGVTYPEAHANIVLLPWPLRVRARDFHAVRYTLPNMDPTEFGFFAFEPEETLDLELVDEVLRAAVDEARTVDVVFLPESAITPSDIEPLEALLTRYGAWCLMAGVREPGTDGGLGENWVHVGVRQELVWRHARQHKHHRWCLDGRQINQYHLGGALAPTMRWWEAVSIPRRSLQIIDQGAVTIAPLLCEDLARLEPVADLLRSIGPSLVLTLLLDGPQLASRWTARYASVLADDPGSAVCTLTSYGMVQRCRPPGCEPSRVVALWKDPSGDLTEIELEDGADAVLIATCVTTSDSFTADGRRHAGTTSTLELAAFRSLRAQRGGPCDDAPPTGARDGADERWLPPLGESEVTKATSWAEALAEAVVAGPATVERVLSRATARDWRARLGLPPPSRLFEQSIEVLRRELPDPPTVEGVLAAAVRLRRSDEPDAVVAGTLIEIALGQRLFAEVQAGRRPPDVLAALAPG